MTEVYSLKYKNVLKYYNYGSHVPFNFAFVVLIGKTSKPSDYITVIKDWMKYMPAGRTANWVVS
jgi:alpha-glucosidase